MHNISQLRKHRIIGAILNRLAFFRIRFSQSNIELVLACLVGIGAGFASVFFRYLHHQIHHLSFEVIYPWLATYSIYLLPVLPMMGAILLIPFSVIYPGEINGYGMPRFLISVHLKGGLIKTRQIFIKIVTAAITIGTGGSAGVEGPIAQIGGAVGSSIGRFFEMGSHRLKVLIACGSAAGIAAQFNAPLAGVLFAQEIVMVGQFHLQTFGVIVIASGLATAISRAYYTSKPTFGVLQYEFISYYEFAFYIILGLMIGVLAYLFIKMFFAIGDRFAHMKIHAQLKPIIGAFIVGVLGLVHFGVMGDGYDFINDAIQSPATMPIKMIVLLVLLKMAATAITLGSGNVGGVFAPCLFIGAMIGAVFGWGVDWLFPFIGIQPGSYAMVGMGAFLAAATHSPMTSIFLLFELTSNYQVIIPIMFASVIGVMVARALCPDSLDSMELSRQNIYLHMGTEANILNTIPVATVMVRQFEKLRETMSFAEFMAFFPSSKAQYYPIVDADDNLTGVVSFQDIREIMLEEGLEHVVVMKDLAQTDLITLTPGDNLTRAIRKFGIKDIAVIPVVDPENPCRILGILNRKDVIDTYNKAILMQDMEMQR